MIPRVHIPNSFVFCMFRSCYYAALLPRRGPHIASHSVCPSVCLSVRLSVRPVVVTERHVAPPSELQWHTCTFRHALRAAYRTAISAAQILVLWQKFRINNRKSLCFNHGIKADKNLKLKMSKAICYYVLPINSASIHVQNYPAQRAAFGAIVKRNKKLKKINSSLNITNKNSAHFRS